jgi:membrane fusion protein, multidrug efflux system
MLTVAGTALLLAGVLACGGKQSAAPGPNASNGPGNGSRGAPGVAQAVTVIAIPVQEALFPTTVEAIGTTKAVESVDIATKVSNRITEIRFAEGQFVESGTVLVQLDADEASAALAEAQAVLNETRNQYKRSRELFETKVLSIQQIEQLESAMRTSEARVAAANARLKETAIRAPFTGRVGLRNVSVGSLVAAGTVITTLDDTRAMKLDFSVPETFLAVLREGLEIEAKSAAYPSMTFKGRVVSVDSRIDPVSRSVIVRAQVPNRDSKLKPGMFMSVLVSRSDAKSLMLPEQALVPDGEQQFVFVVRDQKVHRTEITLGRRRPGEVEVLKGLQVGDQVVTDGTQKIRDGVTVRVADETQSSALNKPLNNL